MASPTSPCPTSPLFANHILSGADLVFRSFLQPMFGRYFGASTAPGLRAQADKTE